MLNLLQLRLPVGLNKYVSFWPKDDFFTQISIQVNRAILSGNSVMLDGDF